ncbi:metallophosphoesterase family protein [bacterium]|nr:metallophosphoesterase family protein [bacterium]
METVAVISDIHGNRWALEAVLADIDRQGITSILNLGDVFYGPLDPAGTAGLLLQRDIPTVRGNEDRDLLSGEPDLSPTAAYTKSRLRDEHLGWLASLPLQLRIGPILMFHGSPSSDTDYFLWRVTEEGASPRLPEPVRDWSGDDSASLILCGHDHVPRHLTLRDGTAVVDPGSVGLPAYRDDAPFPHVMQAGTPHARYTIVRKSGSGWEISPRAVLYDQEAAAAAAERNGRRDWAGWIRTGTAI